VVGYYVGRCRTDPSEAFVRELAKHGLGALGHGYPAGPVIFLADETKQIVSDVDNRYHMERLSDEPEFTQGALAKTISDFFSTVMPERLAWCIAQIITSLLTPTEFDRLKRAAEEWISPTMLPMYMSEISYGRWRLTKCGDMYPAHVEYSKFENGEDKALTLHAPSDDEELRLSELGIYIPTLNCQMFPFEEWRTTQFRRNLETKPNINKK